MNLLSAIGTMYGKLGWADLFTSAGIFTDIVTVNLMNAKPYSRRVAAHLAAYEALMFLKLDSFQQWSKTNDGDMKDFTCYGMRVSQQFSYWDQYLSLVEIALT